MVARRPLVVALLAGATGLLGPASVADSARAAAAEVPSGVTAAACPPRAPGVLTRAPSIPGVTRTVALTFDDGPGRSTPAIIGVLRAFHVRATFFNIGWSATAYPQLVREEAADGYLLGDHTNAHPNLTSLSAADQRREISQVITQQRHLTGTVPCVVRAPYGLVFDTTLAVARELGLTVWGWSAGGTDWQALGSASPSWVSTIASSVIDAARGQDHPVVLLHDPRAAVPATVAALPIIIRWFQSRGYAFVDLLGRTGPPGQCGDGVTPTPSTYATLDQGTTLASGEARSSPNGQFRLEMGTEGRLTYAEVGGPTLWSTPTSGNPGAVATVGAGALTVTATDGRVVWSTETTGTSSALRIGSNGSLTLVSGSSVRWRSGTSLVAMRPGSRLDPGWYVSSPNGRCRLEMTTAGGARLVSADGQTLWRPGAATPGTRVTLEASGDLVARSATGLLAWSTGTAGLRGAVLAVTNSGALRLSDASGTVAWATP